MSDFDPPVPTPIRRTPITLGSIVDLQHEASKNSGFLSFHQCWYRVGGDLNREMVIPTLGATSIGHEIEGVDIEKGPLTSGMSIRLRSTWQNPDWPAYAGWQYLSEWYGDENASYWNKSSWAPHSIWVIEKIEAGNIAAEGAPINSGDAVRIRTKNAKDPENKMYLAKSPSEHQGAFHPWVVDKTARPEEIAWIIWSSGAAR